jgi:hypothetical protein
VAVNTFSPGDVVKANRNYGNTICKDVLYQVEVASKTWLKLFGKEDRYPINLFVIPEWLNLRNETVRANTCFCGAPLPCKYHS